MWNRTFYGYVLALSVTTDIARVRGVYGYQFPKWLTNIDLAGEFKYQMLILAAIDSLEAPPPAFVIHNATQSPKDDCWLLPGGESAGALPVITSYESL